MKPTNMKDVLNPQNQLFIAFSSLFILVFWNTFSTLPKVFIMKHMQIFIYTQRHTFLLHTSQEHTQQVMQGMQVKCCLCTI